MSEQLTNIPSYQEFLEQRAEIVVGNYFQNMSDQREGFTREEMANAFHYLNDMELYHASQFDLLWSETSNLDISPLDYFAHRRYIKNNTERINLLRQNLANGHRATILTLNDMNDRHMIMNGDKLIPYLPDSPEARWDGELKYNAFFKYIISDPYIVTQLDL